MRSQGTKAAARGAVRWGTGIVAGFLAAWLALAGASSVTAKTASKSDDQKTYQGGEDWKWSFDIPAGKSIEVKGINGGIRARRTADKKVEVRAWKHGKHSDPSEVKIEFFEHAGGVTVCAVYPSPDGRPNTCEAGEEGHSHTRNNDVVVEFEVLVPAGVGFVGRTVNGGIEATTLQGPVEAHTVNGGVEVSTTGQAEATTVNGSIKVRMGAPQGKDDLEYTTVNGSITVECAGDLDADLRCSTVNGTIETDYPVMVTGTIGRRKLQGTVGHGGRDLRMETVNGSIHLLKSTI
jgi:hypothetical protein